MTPFAHALGYLIGRATRNTPIGPAVRRIAQRLIERYSL